MDNELSHWGIRGMRWGVRRYQNKDGSLTAAGKKRYNDEMEKLNAEEKILKSKLRTKAKYDKLDAKRKAIEEMKATLGEGKKRKSSDDSSFDTGAEKQSPTLSSKKNKKSDVKHLSNEELRARNERMRLVQEYRRLLSNPSGNNNNGNNNNGGKDKKSGESFIKKTFENVVGKTVEDLGPQVAKHYGARFINEMIGEEAIFANNKKKS